MNRDYVDEALDKAGELMSVIHQPAWQMMVKAFFEVDVVVDDKGVAHQRFDDQKDAVERATTGHGSKEATEYASYMWGEIALSLRDGEVYAVDPEIVELLQAAAGTMPPYELSMSDAPTQHGFIYFPDGLFLTDVRKKTCLCKGITWTAASRVREDHEHLSSGDVVGDFPAKEATAVGYVINVLTDPLDPRDDYNEQYAEGQVQLDRVAGMRAAVHWSPLGQYVWTEGEPFRESAGDAIRFLASFWRFIREPYVEHRSIAPSAHARKRAIRAKRDPSRLRVVRLRKEEHSYEHKGNKVLNPVEWTHRWVVNVGWRDQYYPSLGPAKLPNGERNPDSHRPKFILPFIKGPKDKPLIIKDVAYLVDR